ncbi:MAG: hypothetical protein LBK53_08850 [Heliobacteriaceae bacterium]|jgi:hypothetical protein|nr:hypothetical protein [Heliobacteriaceae bacterium]
MMIQNIIANPALANLAQNTAAAVTIETTMKAVGRPAFILIDKDIKPETKKYAATKELLYQLTCLGVYLALVIPVFKSGSFKLAKNHIFKDESSFKYFKNAHEFLDYHKLAKESKADRAAALSNKFKDKFTPEVRNMLNSENPEKYPLVKGAIELGSIIGSVLGLAVLAPHVSHAVVHPIMKLLKLQDPKKTH